ncbi:Nucleoside-diphosphate-sugar epimerase [Flavobacterium glycines]|uniref:NAD-dependent epimerase n=1 Tax=Flavobacterium glycines TaxID=551990 RepID=A0A1B9DSE5_9FLAO|nr:NAD-dependent epimerase/dehydratase family protein [Flavobacterium glycines]OCB72585.1 NAD-dependent epimerase [Flavobacterium glycines]GEL10081.1 NAD-dependent epimerase [Flavobacterium glycines]SDI82262.1 Nucleoside-diphosphate-sugar epimerase [Flavobacterium glycines]
MILVTGGTGLVGAHLLLHLLENGAKVRAIYRDEKGIQKTKSLFQHYKKPALFDAVEWVQGDILNIPSLEHAFIDITKVYHCAALISFDPKDENKLRKINIEGTANIVNFCLAKGVEKLCHVSSTSALGDLAAHETIITEETEWNPEKYHSDYAISKYGAEMEIWRGQQEGLKVIIVNPGVIIGPGFEDQGSGQLIKKVADGLLFYTYGKTAFVAVNDVVRIMIELMESSICNERFILIGQNIVFRDLFNTIADTLKVKRPSIEARPFLIKLTWIFYWFLNLFFRKSNNVSKDTLQSLLNNKEFSNQKIKTALQTSFTDIHQYIRENFSAN